MQLVQINTYCQENMKKKSGKGFVIQYIMQPFKGQLIPKGFFDVIVSTKKRRGYLTWLYKFFDFWFELFLEARPEIL